MFQSLVKRLFVVALLIAGSGSQSYATTYYVRMTGKDSNSGQSRNAAFRTIQHAVSKANGNDTIYVGAGTYNESIYKYYNSHSGVGSLMLIGDTAGTATGDKGQVVIQVPNRRWGLRVYYAQFVYVNGIDFEAESENSQSYGLYTYRCGNYTYCFQCNFRDLYYGQYNHDCRYSYNYRCNFENNILAFYSNKTGFSYTYQSEYQDCRYGFYAVDAEYAYSYLSNYRYAEDSDGNVPGNYPIRAYRSGLYVYGNKIENPTHAVYASGLTLGYVLNTTVTNPRGWGVHASGTKLYASNLKVTGKGNRRGWGVLMNDTSGKTLPYLQNVDVQGLYGGVMVYQSAYKFSNVKSNQNYIGIYVHPETPHFDFNARTKVQLSENTIGLYATHDDARPGSVKVRNFNFTNNDYGLYTVRTDVDLDDCNFTDNARGAWLVHSKQIDVADCTFNDNQARQNWHHYGMYIHSEKARVVRCEFKNNQTGLYIHNLNDGKPRLSKLQFANNSYMGLRVHEGQLNIRPRQQIEIDNSTYGIYTRFTDVNIARAKAPTNCRYPWCHVDGSLAITNSEIEGGHHGLHAVRTNPTKVSNVTVRDATSIGMYFYQPNELLLSKVSSTNNKHHGFYIHTPTSVTMQGCVSDSNGSHGLYAYMPEEGEKKFAVSNSQFSNNTYGYRTINIPFNSSTVNNVVIQDNNHGLRVERSTMELDSNVAVTIKGNRYGAMGYYGTMDVKDVSLSDNQVSLYNWDCSLNVSNVNLDSKLYGVISYAGLSKITDTKLSGGSYGIYFSPRNRTNEMDVSNVQFDGVRHIGFYAYSHGDRIADVNINNATVNGGNYGIYSVRSKVDVQNTNLNSINNYAIYQNQGEASYTDVTAKSGSWGVVTYGDVLNLRRTKVDSRYGLYLRSKNTQLVNTVVQNSVYGVYTNHAEGQYEILQSTIGNISHYGVMHNQGNLVLRNSIVDADIYALWNRSTNGTLEHDHNLIHADRQSYVNELPGVDEIDKQPIFLDPKAGDLHLAAGSPAINAGVALTDVTVADIEGNARPSFRQFELGAFEFTDAAGSLRILDWEEQAK